MDMYPRLTYTEAVEILRSKNEAISPDGLSKKNETFLVFSPDIRNNVFLG